MSKKRIATGVSLAACAIAVVPVASAEASANRSSGVVVRVASGGKSLTMVGSHGTAKRVRLARKAPRGVKGGSKVVVAGGKVVSAKGRAHATRVRAKIVSRNGRKAAVATDGSPLSVIIGGTTIDLSSIPVGATVSIEISFGADGKPVVKVTLPGTTTPAPTPSVCPPPAIIGTIIAINRTTSKVMVNTASGERKTFTAPDGSLTTLKRGNQVLIADDNADGTAEVVSALSGTARQLTGEVSWIDTGWGAFGLAKADGSVEVVDATTCQLADLNEGDSVTAVVHEDADGEVIADAVTVAAEDDSEEDPWHWGGHHRSWPASWND